MTIRTVSVLGAGCVALALFSACRAETPTPTALALIVEVGDAGVRLLSAKPSSGLVRPPAVDERIAALRRGDAVLIEYALTSSPGALASPAGRFIVSNEAIVESVDPRMLSGTVRVRSRVVSVKVPYVPDASTIAFTRVEPSMSDPIDRWRRVPAGTSPLLRAPVR